MEPKAFFINFNGGYNNCLSFLHHTVKPIEGVIKFDLSSWTLFPSTVEQAKELACKWSASLEARKDFANKKVVIYFHLYHKTLRVEVKKI